MFAKKNKMWNVLVLGGGTYGCGALRARLASLQKDADAYQAAESGARRIQFRAKLAWLKRTLRLTPKVTVSEMPVTVPKTRGLRSNERDHHNAFMVGTEASMHIAMAATCLVEDIVETEYRRHIEAWKERGLEGLDVVHPLPEPLFDTAIDSIMSVVGYILGGGDGMCVPVRGKLRLRLEQETRCHLERVLGGAMGHVGTGGIGGDCVRSCDAWLHGGVGGDERQAVTLFERLRDAIHHRVWMAPQFEGCCLIARDAASHEFLEDFVCRILRSSMSMVKYPRHMMTVEPWVENKG